MMLEDLRSQSINWLRAGIAAVSDYPVLRDDLTKLIRDRRFGRVVIVGIGKAALSMASAASRVVDAVSGGVVVVPHGYLSSWTSPVPWDGNAVLIEAGHPFADDSSCRAAKVVLEVLAGGTAADLVICFISGGGSALVGCPIPSVSRSEFDAALQSLYRDGSPIGRVNAVRRGISRLAGGGVACAAAPATVRSYILSDVPGDDAGLVASGPTTLPSFDEIENSVAAVERLFSPAIADAVRERLSVRPDVALANISVGSNRDAVRAVAKSCAEAGINVRDMITVVGEARDAGEALAVRAMRELRPGEAFVFGGETTVSVAGNGRGGRCQELVLAGAGRLESGGIDAVISCIGTDGVDGPTDAAGAAAAISSGSERWASVAARALAENDSYTALETNGSLVILGPTHTNVMDVGVIVVPPNP